MTDTIERVGPLRNGGLSVALARLATIALRDPSASRIVLDLVESIDTHPPGPITLPPGIERLLVRGRGKAPSDSSATAPAGFLHTVVGLPPGSADIRLSRGADVEYQDIRFVVSQIQPLSLFLQESGDSTLRFTNCVAGVASASDQPSAGLTLARLRGPDDRIIADGLRVGLGFTHAIDARAPVDRVASSPLVDLRRCGFRDLDVAVRLVNISHARVRESVFAECGTGLWSTSEAGAAPGGHLHVADNRFQDCERGLIVQDRSARAAVAGPSPSNERPYEPPDDSEAPQFRPATTPPSRRAVRVVRNEFRAPEAKSYPDFDLLAPVDSWGILDGETIGARLEFDPHPPSTTAPFGAQLLVQANVVHLLDHGIGVVIGQHGQVVIDHNTFVANAVRSVFLRKIDSSKVPGIAFVVARNLFQSVEERPWLGLLEGAVPPQFVAPHYRHGGVEIEPVLSGSVLRAVAWVASNVFADFGAGNPRIFTPVGFGAGLVELQVWEGATTSGPLGLTRWSNREWSERERSVVLRLPRVRRVQGEALTMVEFDYHVALGAAAAPGLVAETSDVFGASWLRAQGIDINDPTRDYHGEDMSFHRQTTLSGACRERRPAAGWPLISWGPGSLDLWERLVDDVMGGRVYFHRRGSALNGELTLGDLAESFGSGEQRIFSWLNQADSVDGGRVVFLPVWAYCNDPDDPEDDPLPGVEDHHDLSRDWVVEGDERGCRQDVLAETGWVELPVKRKGCGVDGDTSLSWCSFDGGEWPKEFVDYWIERATRYVQLLSAWDTNNRITGWVISDEMGGGGSIAEFMARAKEAVEGTDPMRRPVYSGLQSVDSKPHWGGLSGALGGASLHHNQSLGLRERTWKPPSWGSQRGATMFLGQEPRSYRGSEIGDPIGAGRNCLVGDLTSAVPLGADEDCRNDFGVILAAPLDARGRPRFTSHHVQSSWHHSRSVGDPRDRDGNRIGDPSADLTHTTDRSYSHHHGLVLRDTLELGRLVAERSLTVGRQDGHTFFNPIVFRDVVDRSGTPTYQPAAPFGLHYYRHDFWAGVHHAGGVWCYKLSDFNVSKTAGRNGFASLAAEEALELIKGTNPDGLGLREALANGQRWQTMREGDPGPTWLADWDQPDGVSANVDFGPGAGRTFGEPQFFEPGYYDVCTTALRLGRWTFLIITNSRDQDRTLQLRPGGKYLNLTPASGATVTTTPSGRLSIRFDDIDAVVIRITHGSMAP